MIFYEITAVVNAEEPVEKYERFMCERHIPDLLATGCFRAATFARRANENFYRIVYEAHDARALDRYLTEHAPRLRADFLAHFPVGIEFTREVWTVLQKW
jgi:hypothetical protein